MLNEQATIGTFDEAVDHALALLETPGRAVLGITGAPAAGKSTLAEGLLAALQQRVGPRVAHVPMDGFHLADRELIRLGRLDGKGAPDTFDAHGYAALLERIRTERGAMIYAPAFERELEQPLAGAIAVGPEADLVITEGNYLLLDGPGWVRARASVDPVWYCEADQAVRRQRLLGRHLQFGKEESFAAEWIATVDEPNAALVAGTAGKADRWVAPAVVTAAGRRTGR